ncbi:Rv2175c family DNA-binding protein [Leucobacter sp. M11]|uniref:Rv2175c family DNA-binding protein n=1 Tax=Leucobacter sp. M11 TaxID=2993565 RepID=UPI002D7EA2B6|nr:Rv2175c family DNA-binding protein [Leucobacter sp. M11]MEB4616564.1 Rv2175c family DNA-binding protein [Leucobacter sp. M11]
MSKQLISETVTVPDLAERLDLSASKVRRMLENHQLAALRIDGVLRIPELFLTEEGPLSSLHGTIVVLRDAGYSNDEVIDWLLTENEAIGGRPIDSLRAGRKAEVRRLAQALSF